MCDERKRLQRQRARDPEAWAREVQLKVAKLDEERKAQETKRAKRYDDRKAKANEARKVQETKRAKRDDDRKAKHSKRMRSTRAQNSESKNKPEVGLEHNPHNQFSMK